MIDSPQLFFDRAAQAWDLWSERYPRYRQELFSLLKFLVPEGSRVAEIGCATGDLLNQLKPRQGTGYDFSPAMIIQAKRKYPHLTFVQAQAALLPPVTAPYDYVVLSELVGVSNDVQKVFEQLRPLCKSSTRVVVTHHNYLWEPVLRLATRLGLRRPLPLENWLPPEDIENLFRLSGFEVIKRGNRCLLPIYVPLITEFLNRYCATLPLLRHFCLIQFVVARPQPDPARAEKPAYTCSIIAPCRNEKGNIQDCIKRTPLMGSETELIFVDGSSKDGTVETIEAEIASYRGPLKIRLIHQGNGTGKGDAVRKGFAAARGDILMILDTDLTVPPEELPKFFSAMESGAGEFINGTRLVYPLEKEAMRFLNILGNKFFSVAFTWLLEQRIRDTLCGTKVLFRSDYERIAENRSYFGGLDPFGDFDLLFGAAKLNLKIVEVPIRYRARRYGETKISRFHHGWLLLRMCLLAYRKLKVASS